MKRPGRLPPSILHLSATDWEGGAARAAVRLHLALRELGTESRMLVQDSQGMAPGVLGPRTPAEKLRARLGPYLDRILPALAGQRPGTMFHAAWLPDGLPRRVRELAPAVVHAHWTGQGFMRLESLGRFGRPAILTLHDLWGLTGGCHVAGHCRRFEAGCGRCPMLRGWPWDLSKRVVLRKRRAWPRTLRVVAPSRWMAEEARRSAALRTSDIRVIPNGLDTALFRPVDKRLCRGVLGMDPAADHVLFGAVRASSDENKGLPSLRKALEYLAARRPRRKSPPLHLTIFGAWAPETDLAFPFPVTWLGPIRDDRILALAYAAASLVVVPSKSESFGQVASEALACGTPVACFDTSGLKDVVTHRVDGYRAKPFDPEDLAEGIAWCLKNSAALGRAGRRRAESDFDRRRVAEAHRELYLEALRGP